MADKQRDWSVDALLREWKPHSRWRNCFSEAFAQVMEGRSLEEQLRGWRTAAITFGDTHACQLCLFVCYYVRSVAPERTAAFLAHIDVCLMEMGLAVPVKPGLIRIIDFGKPKTMRRDQDAIAQWLDRELAHFDDDLGRAAEFSMRLGAIRLGLLTGPENPTIQQILDSGSWVTSTAP